jgi:hypothetical protein
MIIIPFKPEHLAQIDRQAEQSVAREYLDNEEYIMSLAAHEAWTGIIDDRVVACAGLIRVWGERYQAWAVISETIGAHGMLQLSRAVKRGLNLRKGRIEAYVASGFEAGHRWARLVGMELETPVPMKHWLPDGSDASQYSRVT